ncbi:MAG: DUF4421 domain-containing protein [Prevotella sp.]|uniref:DUF4421 domain-containing protein n=1 Tax=Prevotella sp. TaxID=59823 RepID=UPI002A3527ED|nr:DUF4421 domain-containing protein [Prevotella sp.]MDD7318137.1 DUF4421 domain-containing protein [Prevotellaceae bacterium]MDY4020974.1 DUF4421 domain-containing protein [Prevotella sp.]
MFVAVSVSACNNCETGDSVAVDVKKGIKKGNAIYRLFKSFTEIDTAYIEPQHYEYTVMLQNTTTYEIYKLTSKSGQTITFAPKPTVKIGPFVGWRSIFLGYTLDVNHLSNSNNKKEFDISIYSSQIGIDLYYRKSGDDYLIKSVKYGDNRISPKDVAFSGIEAGIKGFNIYYIFNHKIFSYPAAFSQSTVQKKSCGSPLIGIGYASHSLTLDYNKLHDAIANMPDFQNEERVDSGLMFNNVKYVDYSVSGGYAYNYVFARNCLFAVSLSLAVAYKRSIGERQDNNLRLRDFLFSNFNMDAIGRFGLVYNNMKWYCGASAIIKAYNYRKPQFSTNNVFGSLNIYVGLNFGKKKEYRKKK